MVSYGRQLTLEFTQNLALLHSRGRITYMILIRLYLYLSETITIWTGYVNCLDSIVNVRAK